ncbi:MAG: penicillin acylase family protein [Spirochaetales bacterium]|nr:penicillin acylase family protein [Spirochaetales bacterium]
MKARQARQAVAVAVLVLVQAGTLGCVILPARAFPKATGAVEVPGLQAPVEIIRDSYGVPHIYARNAEDLFFAQGYVHAQDRFWQMEFSRRVGSGRLAELFGEKLLETDIFLRTVGLYRVAQKEYELLDPEAKGYLDAYVAGVNACIADKKPGQLALEYSLLKLTGTEFEIEPWTAAHSITWAKMMSYDLSANMDLERELFELLRTAGVPGAEDMFAPYREDMPFVLTDEELGLGGLRAPSGGSELHLAGRAIPWFLGQGAPRGSNTWVISGSRTTSGKPILANDTHLGIQMPSIWYEIGLHTVDEQGRPLEGAPGQYQVRGFSFPGYPGVIIGHNGRIAWGITDFGDDVQDFYYERINPLNPSQYLAGGQWRDMKIRHERIDIQGQEQPYVHVVRETRHGPIVTDRGGYKPLESYGFAPQGEFPDNLELSAVALRWTALEPGRIWMCFVRLNRARSFEEFRDAFRYFDGPVLNVSYADTAGNIGYQTTGWIPIRPVGEGRIPVPGWTEEFEWSGYVPFDELPSALNPEKGYIISANNPVASPSYPYMLGTTAAYGYRARRLAQMIENDPDGVSIEDTMRMQADVTDQAAGEITAYLRGLNLAAPPVSDLLREKEPLSRKDRKKKAKLEAQVEAALEPARERLLAWDGNMDMESAEATLYGFFFLSLIEETFEDQYPYQRWPKAKHARMQNALYYLLEDPENPWWDDARTPEITESRDLILVRAFRKAVERGIEELGAKLEKWEWGDVHTTEFRNATLGESGIKLIEKIFNRGPVATPGNATTVYAAAWKKDEPFAVNHGTTNRQIIDLGDIARSFMMHAPGQSGHPRHRHYDDYIDPWRKVEYHPTLFDRADVEDNQRARLLLRPATAE